MDKEEATKWYSKYTKQQLINFLIENEESCCRMKKEASHNEKVLLDKINELRGNLTDLIKEKQEFADSPLGKLHQSFKEYMNGFREEIAEYVDEKIEEEIQYHCERLHH